LRAFLLDLVGIKDTQDLMSSSELLMIGVGLVMQVVVEFL
jgi:hypothetical protein